MPDQQIHIKKAKKNIGFLECCESSSDIQISSAHSDWSVIVKFYACLHVLEAIAAPKGLHFPSHCDRNRKIYIYTTLFDREFCNRYVELYALSLKARYADYNSVSVSLADLRDADEHYSYILNYAKTNAKLNLN